MPVRVLSIALVLALSTSSSWMAFGAPAPVASRLDVQERDHSIQISPAPMQAVWSAAPNTADRRLAERLLDLQVSRRVEAQLPDLSSATAAQAAQQREPAKISSCGRECLQIARPAPRS